MCTAPTGPACLQPQYLSADSGTTSLNLRRGEGTAGSGPFIFDPHAAKRKAASAAAAAQAAIPEWVSRVLLRVVLLVLLVCKQGWSARCLRQHDV